MSLRPFLVAVALCTVGIAGCSGPAEVAAAPPTSAPPPQANETTASVVGVVVDEEQRPIADVDVAEAKTRTSARSDAEGRFTLNGLQPGKIVLLFQRVGYEQLTRSVDTLAGEVAEVRVTLVAFAIPSEPYHESKPKTGHIVLGNALLTTIWYQGVNQSVYNTLVCDPCRFTLYLEPNPADILSEAIWTSGAGAGYINNEIFVNYLKKGTDADYAEPNWLYYGYHKNRQGVHWPEAQLKKMPNMEQIRLWLRPDLDGVSVDHTVTVWTTFGYHGPLPEGFSALPPP
ncbi:MAG: carboxypeptidase regulatory-like domain-containing protein [Euryarchaeota archaeon]|nr:carboxypeptidase regulatory-like domain-containing protein [Euryarchaeota archaeon]